MHSNCTLMTLYLGQLINVYSAVGSFLQEKNEGTALQREHICNTCVWNLVSFTVHSNCVVKTLFLDKPINVCSAVGSFLQERN